MSKEPKMGQVWRGGKNNDEFYRVFSVVQCMDNPLIELQSFGISALMQVTMKWWIDWSATATLVSGGEDGE